MIKHSLKKDNKSLVLQDKRKQKDKPVPALGYL